MKKSVFVLVLLCIMLFSCTAQTASKDAKTVVTDFRSGTEGLSMSFMPNMPPARLFGNDDFNVMIRIENRGTFSLSDVNTIFLTGFDPSIITGVAKYVSIPMLEGRNQFMPQGGFDMVSFKGRINQISGFDKYNPTIMATECYRYDTVGTAQVCLDSNPFAPSSSPKVCVPANVATGSQGAPIAVSSVEVSSGPSKTRFAINIQNVGGGDVFKLSSLKKCDPALGLSYNDLDFVNIGDVMVSGQSIRTSCKPVTPEGFIRLTNGKATLFCEVQTTGNAFLTPLSISLSYGYRQSISTTVEIRPSV